MKVLKRERGVALLMVMFIMALLTTLMAYLVEDDQLSIRRVSNQQESEQGFHIAVYSEQWARKSLEDDIGDNQVDYIGEAWNEESPGLNDSDAATLETEVSDLQGRFNLNNLAVGHDEVWYPAFQRLLTVLDLDVGLADAVVDWVDADIEVSGNAGAEDAEYLLKDPPYRAANRFMAAVSELAWIQGMTPEALEKLLPHVAALPATGVHINVNTATAEVLRILHPSILDESGAEALISGRGEEGYASTDDFLVLTALAGQSAAIEPMISVNSEYFEVRSQVQVDRYTTVLYSVIQRPASTGQATVIQRRRGVS